jgi:hypothetical protein
VVVAQPVRRQAYPKKNFEMHATSADGSQYKVRVTNGKVEMKSLDGNTTHIARDFDQLRLSLKKMGFADPTNDQITKAFMKRGQYPIPETKMALKYSKGLPVHMTFQNPYRTNVAFELKVTPEKSIKIRNKLYPHYMQFNGLNDELYKFLRRQNFSYDDFAKVYETFYNNRRAFHQTDMGKRLRLIDLYGRDAVRLHNGRMFVFDPEYVRLLDKEGQETDIIPIREFHPKRYSGHFHKNTFLYLGPDVLSRDEFSQEAKDPKFVPNEYHWEIDDDYRLLKNEKKNLLASYGAMQLQPTEQDFFVRFGEKIGNLFEGQSIWHDWWRLNELSEQAQTTDDEKREINQILERGKIRKREYEAKYYGRVANPNVQTIQRERLPYLFKAHDLDEEPPIPTFKKGEKIALQSTLHDGSVNVIGTRGTRFFWQPHEGHWTTTAQKLAVIGSVMGAGAYGLGKIAEKVAPKLIDSTIIDMGLEYAKAKRQGKNSSEAMEQAFERFDAHVEQAQRDIEREMMKGEMDDNYTRSLHQMNLEEKGIELWSNRAATGGKIIAFAGGALAGLGYLTTLIPHPVAQAVGPALGTVGGAMGKWGTGMAVVAGGASGAKGVYDSWTGNKKGQRALPAAKAGRTVGTPAPTPVPTPIPDNNNAGAQTGGNDNTNTGAQAD